MGSEPTAPRTNSATVSYALLVAAATLVVRLAVSVSDGPGYVQSLLLVHATGIVFAATLFSMIRPPADQFVPGTALHSGAVACAVFLAAVLVDPELDGSFIMSAPLFLPVFLFVVITSALALQVSNRWMNSTPLVMVILGILFALPLWLGPLALVVRDADRASDLIVAASPLSALASAIDFDYLRTPWFYRNSVLGSLRYAYPTWPNYAVTLALIAIALLSLLRITSKTPMTATNRRETSP